MSLKVYNRKRKFSKTPEPKGKESKSKTGPLKFVVQLHNASRLHYDFRLEYGGALKSWAVPKGPSLNPMDQRLAVFVEDHPLDYGSFEGIIPKGNYGAGTVMVWDTGTYIERGSEGRKDSESAMKKGFEKGHMTFILEGEKLKGEFALIKLKKSEDKNKAWLLVKKRDTFSAYKDITKQNLSVKTGRSMDEIAAQSQKKEDIWLSKRKTQKIKPNKKGPRSTTPVAPLPRRVKPLVATMGGEIPKDGSWIYEQHLDGLRALAELDGRTVHLHSRSLLPFDKKFPDIVKELKTLKHKMVLDGEILIKGKASTYWVYDILYFDGKDLRESPLSLRKKILADAFKDSKIIHHQEYFSTPKKIPGKNIEVIAKNLKSIYRSGITKDWVRLTSQSSKLSKNSSSPNTGLRLTHLDKVFFPGEGYTKGDLINYYKDVAPYILPYLKDRPESLNRHPNGIAASGFYQKDMAGYNPKWFKTQRIYSESRDKSVDYPVVQNEESLLYIVNLGCIEINPWFSRIDALENPDFLVIDLDPDGNSFKHVMDIAKELHEILDAIGAPNYIKTSGATGLHICVH